MLRAAAEDKSRLPEVVPPPSTVEAQAKFTADEGPETSTANCSEPEAPMEVEELECRTCPVDDVNVEDRDTSSGQVEVIKQQFLERTEGCGIPQLERLYTRIIKGVFETKSTAGSENIKSKVVQFLSKFSQDVTNF